MSWRAIDEADARARLIVACKRATQGLDEVLDWMRDEHNRDLIPSYAWRFIMDRLVGANTDLNRAREMAEGKESVAVGKQRRGQAKRAGSSFGWPQ